MRLSPMLEDFTPSRMVLPCNIALLFRGRDSVVLVFCYVLVQSDEYHRFISDASELPGATVMLTASTP